MRNKSFTERVVYQKEVTACSHLQGMTSDLFLGQYLLFAPNLRISLG